MSGLISVGERCWLANHDHTQCRDFTNQLMREIARLSEREYIDEYVPARTSAA